MDLQRDDSGITLNLGRIGKCGRERSDEAACIVTGTSALTREEEQAEVILRLEEDITFRRSPRVPPGRGTHPGWCRYSAIPAFRARSVFSSSARAIVLRENHIGATRLLFYSTRRCGDLPGVGRC